MGPAAAVRGGDARFGTLTDGTTYPAVTMPESGSTPERAARRRGVGAWVRAALAAVGLGRGAKPPTAPPPADRGTQLAEERTRLALERSFLAAERTLMAWIRTSMSMISFGFTMVKFFEYLEEERKVKLPGLFGESYGTASLGLTLISIGTLALVVAVVQHRQALRMLHTRGLPSRWSLALTVATLVAVLGVFAFGSLVLRY